MATKENIDASDEIITLKCCVCTKKNITRDAEKYCVECQDYYCIPCTDTHKMFPALSGHQILDKADFSSHGLHVAELPSYPTERCSTHKAKLLVMFCTNHNEVVCASCVAIHHRACQEIRSIPEDIDNLYRKSSLRETKTKVNAMKKTMEDIKKSKEQLLQELKIHKNKAVDSIRNFRKEMEAMLEKLEKDSIQEAEAQYEKTESILHKQIKEAEEFNVDLVQYYKKLERSAGNKAQEFVCVKQTEETIGKAENAEQILRKGPDMATGFQPDVTIKNFLNQFKTLGKISITSTKLKLKTTVYTKRAENEINVKLTKDKSDCCIYGFCFTSDGSLLLTDFNNNKLKYVDISTATVMDHLDLCAKPHAVCQVSDNEAAVSLVNKTIQFVSLGYKMATTRQLKLNHRCFGLAYKNGRMFISDFSSTVYIYGMTGTMLNKITADRSGNEIFSCSRHISLSANIDRVYIADEENGLITLDTQGNYVSTFTDPDGVLPWAICTDGKGNIFVCGSSNIVQISEESGRKLGVLKDMMVSLSASFDPQQNKLALTGSGNNVSIFELE
ncbi:uncharacterized protein LOC123551800 [Mercenaria mercenaria]|uniref:uncharacterized protein LOC123551800 n=1 Tax=Mercenaria mercenaria TaxID=6596 RepID=UPI00234F84C9|nr:uncharacterized protein LOC123551800 [Mercenaria mercenaria]